jgi:hypothetical protein
MRMSQIFLVLGLAGGCIILFFFISLWPLLSIREQYFGLQHKSTRYYVDFTAACDTVLAEHPIGTNEFIQIPLTDPSLPKVITKLQPIKIKVGRQHFWMLLGSDSHSGFGLTWEPQWGHTNVWVLHTTAESLDTVLYTSERFVQPTPP